MFNEQGYDNLKKEYVIIKANVKPSSEHISYELLSLPHYRAVVSKPYIMVPSQLSRFHHTPHLNFVCIKNKQLLEFFILKIIIFYFYQLIIFINILQMLFK
jgi:hypothetical protein